MQLLTACALIAAAAAAATAPGDVASPHLFCDCRVQHHHNWAYALHCARQQNGSSEVSCQKHWVPDIPRGYHYIPGYALVKLYGGCLTWAAARKFCEDDGAQLALPRDQNAFDGLKQILRTEKAEKRVWWGNIGITDEASEGIFIGVDGLPAPYLPWRPNEPNNFGGDENCLYVDENGLLNDWHCDQAEPFFCERRLLVTVPASYVWLHKAGRFYKVHTEKHGHAEAANVCHSENATLVVADTWQRLEAVLNLLEVNGDFYHTGFTDESVEGDFVTETGRHLRDMEFQLWNVGEPNNRDGDGKPQNCLALSNRGYYNDESCDLPLPFICEIAPI